MSVISIIGDDAVLTGLKLRNFKNFREAHIQLGSINVLIGANASGKSNLRDAFRFLHGIARGYSLAEIMGEKYADGGVLQWRGIRGGPREILYPGADSFMLRVTFQHEKKRKTKQEISPGVGRQNLDRLPDAVYTIEVSVSELPVIRRESLYLNHSMVFDTHPPEETVTRTDTDTVGCFLSAAPKHEHRNFSSGTPILAQLRSENGDSPFSETIQSVAEKLSSIRFFDPHPEVMRQPSFPGQTILGDRGENLSPVLQAVCADKDKRKALVEWLRELTPSDARDLDFMSDPTGKIILALVEGNNRKISAYSASDGTLRFLAVIAALMGPKPGGLLIFEEMENGLHPSRVHLLTQLLEQKTREMNLQVLATTHSPQLLRYLSGASLEHASLIYRGEDSPEGRITRLIDIPDFKTLIEDQDAGRLHESGWYEDAVFFLSEAGR